MSATARTMSNDEWVAGLGATPVDEAVVGALRGLLIGALSKSLAGRGDVRSADIEDFAQDAVVRILERIDSFRGESKFTTWAIAVAIRVAYSHLRKRSWGERTLEDLDLSPDGARHAPTAPNVSAGSEKDELLGALRNAIENDLTPRQRAAILGELAGMPTETLAEQLGLKANALYKLHHDGRKKLLGALESAGFTADSVRESLDGASSR